MLGDSPHICLVPPRRAPAPALVVPKVVGHTCLAATTAVGSPHLCLLPLSRTPAPALAASQVDACTRTCCRSPAHTCVRRPLSGRPHPRPRPPSWTLAPASTAP
eukprot:365533-Chlamydomonas_euryale.AAC.12